jgi:hypothetical protein
MAVLVFDWVTVVEHPGLIKLFSVMVSFDNVVVSAAIEHLSDSISRSSEQINVFSGGMEQVLLRAMETASLLEQMVAQASAWGGVHSRDSMQPASKKARLMAPSPPASSPLFCEQPDLPAHTSPDYSPTSPAYCPTSPAYCPSSPAYSPTPPPIGYLASAYPYSHPSSCLAYNPSSPPFTPATPVYSPVSPAVVAPAAVRPPVLALPAPAVTEPLSRGGFALYGSGGEGARADAQEYQLGVFEEPLPVGYSDDGTHFICDLCPRKSKRENYMIKHVIMHSDEIV